MSGLRAVLCVVLVLVLTVDAQEDIKMCGRDLIRKAMSYCGGSRLRRAVVTLTMKDRRPVDPSSPPASTSASASALGPVPPQREDMEALVAQWLPLSARMRRTALKISDLCCEKGCSKRELIQFC
ncbi:unnamed protein product [Knipowitschia caucasica]|uniref:Insulin-like 3 n=1 Tax=Knipowitschia caucasica TaxID=637954 RepID=A0AAV2JNY4_KNICA